MRRMISVSISGVISSCDLSINLRLITQLVAEKNIPDLFHTSPKYHNSTHSYLPKHLYPKLKTHTQTNPHRRRRPNIPEEDFPSTLISPSSARQNLALFPKTLTNSENYACHPPRGIYSARTSSSVLSLFIFRKHAFQKTEVMLLLIGGGPSRQDARLHVAPQHLGPPRRARRSGHDEDGAQQCRVSFSVTSEGGLSLTDLRGDNPAVVCRLRGS